MNMIETCGCGTNCSTACTTGCMKSCGNTCEATSSSVSLSRRTNVYIPQIKKCVYNDTKIKISR